MKHKIELLEEIANGRQKIYKLDFDIYRDIKGNPISDSIAHCKDQAKERNPLLELCSGEKSTNLICVSDAFTHFERLVFPAVCFKNKKTQEKEIVFDYLDIAGEITMMIFGGDASTMKSVEEYVDQLWKANEKDNKE